MLDNHASVQHGSSIAAVVVGLAVRNCKQVYLRVCMRVYAGTHQHSVSLYACRSVCLRTTLPLYSHALQVPAIVICSGTLRHQN
jgi:hypothetical protein